MRGLIDSAEGMGGQNGGGGGNKADPRIFACSGEAMEGRGESTGGRARRLRCESRFFLWTSHLGPVGFSFPVDKVGYQACLPAELSQDAMRSWYTYLPSPPLSRNLRDHPQRQQLSSIQTLLE